MLSHLCSLLFLVALGFELRASYLQGSLSTMSVCECVYVYMCECMCVYMSVCVCQVFLR
jgi:hypothetical protein